MVEALFKMRRLIGIAACLVVLSLSLLAVPVKAYSDESNQSMLAYGTIHDDKGHVLASDVFFTAFISRSSYFFLIGYNTWDQASYAMVWGNAGSPTAITGPTQYVELKSGYVLHIGQLWAAGKSVTSVQLNNSTMDLTAGNDSQNIAVPAQTSSINGGSPNNPCQTFAIVAATAALEVIVIILVVHRKSSPKEPI
jgi:hypothetical protein